MPDEKEYRKEILLKMYDQRYNAINRNIMVVWQSIGLVIGAFAIFALTEKKVFSVDIATTIILSLGGWLLAHIYSVSYGYNIDLAIISNIEREFLEDEDLHKIHYYFGAHRPKNIMAVQLRIQFTLAIFICLYILFYHFLNRVITGFSSSIFYFEIERALPYFTTIVVIIGIILIKKLRDESYEDFLKYSPGKQIETTGIEYGRAHGFLPILSSSTKITDNRPS